MERLQFEIIKQSKKSRARLGVLRTPHGEVQTPALVTVATQGTVKAVSFAQAQNAGTQLLICNTYHLHQRPGEAVVRDQGGLHEFSGWQRPIMTDSGGYQVFSLGFGRDYGVGKIGKTENGAEVTLLHKPKGLKISEDGVKFKSYLDGRELDISPEKSMQIQSDLGADIIFAFDECTPPNADRAYSEASMHRTHRWADRSLAARNPAQALYGIVQGGKFPELRQESAKQISARPFDGIGIGGEFGEDKETMDRMLDVVVTELPNDRPRHLLGIGHPDDIERVIRAGVDTFDCTVPTQYARHGTAFTSRGKLHVGSSSYLRVRGPLDEQCDCPTCANHSLGYICHLLRAHEIMALTMLTVHNLHHFNALVAVARKRVAEDLL
ncbi:MAG: tRNA guanosine(34) transglycosylase Tgt [Patescibacteria group bacterium]